MLTIVPNETARALEETAVTAVIVPPEGGIAAVVQTAATSKVVAKTESTIQELAEHLPRPLAHFLLTRVPAGHMLTQEAAAKILEKKSADGMAIESALLFLQYVFDHTAPDPAADNWSEQMKERQVLEEFLRDRLKRVLMLPHMRNTAP